MKQWYALYVYPEGVALGGYNCLPKVAYYVKYIQMMIRNTLDSLSNSLWYHFHWLW